MLSEVTAAPPEGSCITLCTARAAGLTLGPLRVSANESKLQWWLRRPMEVSRVSRCAIGQLGLAQTQFVHFSRCDSRSSLCWHSISGVLNLSLTHLVPVVQLCRGLASAHPWGTQVRSGLVRLVGCSTAPLDWISGPSMRALVRGPCSGGISLSAMSSP